MPRRPAIASPKKVASITKIIVVLHDFFMSITGGKFNLCPINFVRQHRPNGSVPRE